MSSPAVIVDSCIWIGFMRSGRDPRQELMPLLRAGHLYNCGVIRAEVLRGMKFEKRMRELEAFFDIIPEVPTDAKIWRQVSTMGWSLARLGKTPQVTDLTIAACAMRTRATLVTVDKHFDALPGLNLSATLPEV